MEKEFEYKEEYAWLTNICLNVTDACNLACRYCFVEQHPHYMTLNTAKQAVYFILNNLEKKNKKFNKNEKAQITFFGGEPTLMWDEIIVPLTNWIKENNYPILLGMTTNGTLLNKERIIFLKDNNFDLLLSIDGNEKTQNYNRPCKINENSFDKVIKNIPILLEHFPYITFRGTIYHDTVQETFNNYMFAVEQGFKNIFLMPDARHPWTNDEIALLNQELDKIFIYMNMCFDNEIEPIHFSTIHKMFNSLIDFSYDEKNINISRGIFRCGLGTSSGSIGYDGSIYGCQEQPSKDINNIFYIGHISNGITSDLHQNLIKEYNKKAIAKCVNKEQCDSCSLRKICLGWSCPSTSWDLYQNFHIDSDIACKWREKIFANSMILFTNLKDNKYFKQYFERVIK